MPRTYNGPERRSCPRQEERPWVDPGDTGSWSEEQWRKNVVSWLRDGHERMDANTGLTRAAVTEIGIVRQELQELTVKVQPVVSVTDKMSKGFEVIGWVGTGAEWIVKKWFYIVLIVLAGKLILSGGTWAEVMKLWKEAP